MSRVSLVSAATRFEASEKRATKRPSPLMAAPELGPRAIDADALDEAVSADGSGIAGCRTDCCAGVGFARYHGTRLGKQ